MMNTKHSPAKITLGMMKGKPITTSVPVFHYHASDDELEELYPDMDKNDGLTPDSEEQSLKVPVSPSKSPSKKNNTSDSYENDSEKQVSDGDGSISEGPPQPSDPWKVLSDIKGKITKTFEEKLSEIKSDKKKKNHQSRENFNISDIEDVGDVTPTEGNTSDRQEKEPNTSSVHCKSNSARFVGFSQITTGLKAKNSEEDSIESGVEAAELNEGVLDCTNVDSQNCTEHMENKDVNDVKKDEISFVNSRQPPVTTTVLSSHIKLGTIFTHFKNKLIYQLTYQLVSLLAVVCCSYCFIPLPEYFLGFTTGIFMTVTFYSMLSKTKEILTTPPEDQMFVKPIVPVLEIPAVEEHSVVERFEGWLNELPYAYDPDNYHVARTKSVFFRLEGNVLRIMETRLRIPKRAIWDESKHKLKFTRKRVYNLNGAKVDLLPEGLIRRRRWSKKYPICITLEKGALIASSTLKDSFDKEAFDEQDNKMLVEEENEEMIEKETDKFYKQFQQQKETEEEQYSQEKENTQNRNRQTDEEIEEYEEEEEEDETDEDLMQSSSSKDIFEDCHNDDYEAEYKLFIFARTDRQKEDWYRRLISVTCSSSKRNSISLTSDTPISLNSLLTQQVVNESKSSVSSDTGVSVSSDLTYNVYMSRYLDDNLSLMGESDQLSLDGDTIWINCLLGRILFDMHKCPDSRNLIQNKIQRKLSNIKLPYFMESLLVSEITIGQGAPIIHSTTKPLLDEQGLWIDLNVTYKGNFTMTIETKLNLMKLTRTSSVSTNPNDIPNTEQIKSTRSPMFDSDVEDSPETSTEEEEITNTTVCNAAKDITPTQFSGRKFLSMVDKITANKYFQHATELSYVRRAMEGVSNTEIRLMVSVTSIEGCLTINIPPPPSDRLWYGFKPLPKITLTVKPALGERAVSIGYVTKWIETKLLREFEKVVVLPNMDDLLIPLCPNYPYVTA